ncbi:MAG: hypothetical protein HKN87_22055 [Saprospiraceae bacterium]|nr:hypothetical protein [Saprospiraceae bacterium]
MTSNKVDGDGAFAHGALSGGASVITGYPGSPSSGTLQHLIKMQPDFDFYIEWSVNEKVAAEVAIGASIGGRRSLVCAKSVGMNLMVDPVMTLNLTPLNAGLVILLGDDPGGYGSQNDQDTRPLMHMLELPLLEPADPREGFFMMKQAFELSEQYKLPIIIRETRAFSKDSIEFDLPSFDYDPPNYGVLNEPFRFVPVPAQAVEKHRRLHRQLLAFKGWTEKSAFNKSIVRSKKGIIASGYAYRKLMDTLGHNSNVDLSIYKLSTLHPLPELSLSTFMKSCDEVMVLEETLPFIENALKVIAYDHRSNSTILGKSSGHFPSEGELFRWQISEVLEDFHPGIKTNSSYSKDNEDQERPLKGNPCADCRYEEVLDAINQATQSLGMHPLFTGDPGCLFSVGDRLLAKYAIGSAVALASGLVKAEINQPVVALVGDSGFFHTTIPAICNAAYNQSRITLVLLDNGAAVTSGGQLTPASGFDALGNNTPKLDFIDIARSCGVQHISEVHIDDPAKDLIQTFKEALQADQLSLIVVKIPRRS